MFQKKDVILNRVLFGAQCELGKLNRDMVFVDNLKPVREPERGAEPAHVEWCTNVFTNVCTSGGLGSQSFDSELAGRWVGPGIWGFSDVQSMLIDLEFVHTVMKILACCLFEELFKWFATQSSNQSSCNPSNSALRTSAMVQFC